MVRNVNKEKDGKEKLYCLRFNKYIDRHDLIASYLEVDVIQWVLLVVVVFVILLVVVSISIAEAKINHVFTLVTSKCTTNIIVCTSILCNNASIRQT
jgi:hypothetical protein